MTWMYKAAGKAKWLMEIMATETNPYGDLSYRALGLWLLAGALLELLILTWMY